MENRFETFIMVCGGVLCFYGLIQKLVSGSAAPREKAG